MGFNPTAIGGPILFAILQRHVAAVLPVVHRHELSFQNPSLPIPTIAMGNGVSGEWEMNGVIAQPHPQKTIRENPSPTACSGRRWILDSPAALGKGRSSRKMLIWLFDSARVPPVRMAGNG